MQTHLYWRSSLRLPPTPFGRFSVVVAERSFASYSEPLNRCSESLSLPCCARRWCMSYCSSPFAVAAVDSIRVLVEVVLCGEQLAVRAGRRTTVGQSRHRWAGGKGRQAGREGRAGGHGRQALQAGQAHLCHASAMIDPSTLSRCPLLVMRRQPLARSSSSPRIAIACFTMRFGTLSRRIAARTIRFLAASRGMRETTLAQKAFPINREKLHLRQVVERVQHLPRQLESAEGEELATQLLRSLLRECCAAGARRRRREQRLRLLCLVLAVELAHAAEQLPQLLALPHPGGELCGCGGGGGGGCCGRGGGGGWRDCGVWRCCGCSGRACLPRSSKRALQLAHEPIARLHMLLLRTRKNVCGFEAQLERPIVRNRDDAAR
eukprot:1006646-Prymnesium_polylepis.1